MKTLIVYYSFSGNNEALAKELQRRLNCEIFKITEANRRGAFTIFLDVLFKRTPKVKEPWFDIKTYDHVILIAPIWAGRIASPLKAFIKLEKYDLRDYSFITLCGSQGNKHISKELKKIIQKKPAAVLELAVNDILPPEHQNKLKYTSGHRVDKNDMEKFSEKIDQFLQSTGLLEKEHAH